MSGRKLYHYPPCRIPDDGYDVVLAEEYELWSGILGSDIHPHQFKDTSAATARASARSQLTLDGNSSQILPFLAQTTQFDCGLVGDGEGAVIWAGLKFCRYRRTPRISFKNILFPAK